MLNYTLENSYFGNVMLKIAYKKLVYEITFGLNTVVFGLLLLYSLFLLELKSHNVELNGANNFLK